MSVQHKIHHKKRAKFVLQHDNNKKYRILTNLRSIL